MPFRDQKLTCEQCGATFFFTVPEQRRMAEQMGTDEIEAPRFCPKHRGRESGHRPEETERRPEPPREQPRPRAERSQDRQAGGSSIANAFPLEEEGIEVKLIGTVKWFSREKGYGFITKADGEDLFFHRADISRDEHVWPQDGQTVEFQIRQTEKGAEAFNVSLLPSD